MVAADADVDVVPIPKSGNGTVFTLALAEVAEATTDPSCAPTPLDCAALFAEAAAGSGPAAAEPAAPKAADGSILPAATGAFPGNALTAAPPVAIEVTSIPVNCTTCCCSAKNDYVAGHPIKPNDSSNNRKKSKKRKITLNLCAFPMNKVGYTPFDHTL